MVVGEFTASSINHEQDRMEEDQSEKLKTSKVGYAKLEADVTALKSLAAKVPFLAHFVAVDGCGSFYEQLHLQQVERY